MNNTSKKTIFNKINKRILAVGVSISLLSGGIFLDSIPKSKEVPLQIDGKIQYYTTAAQNINELMKEKKTEIKPDAKINVPKTYNISKQPDKVIVIDNSKIISVTYHGKNKEVKSYKNNVSDLLKELKITLNKDDKLNVAESDMLKDKMTIVIDQISTKTESHILPIPYETITKENPKKYEDSKEVIQKGKDGKNEITVTNEYKNGELVSSTSTSIDIIEKPQEKIIEIGTKPINSTKTEKEEETIPFEKETKKNDKELEGWSKTIKKGKAGKLEKTYEITLEKEKIIKKSLKETKTIEKAENEIIEVGTKPKVTTKEKKEKVSIPFETITRYNKNKYKGTTNTLQNGKKGFKEITYKVTFENGEKKDSTIVDSKIVKTVQNKIIEVGTKEKPAPKPKLVVKEKQKQKPAPKPVVKEKQKPVPKQTAKKVAKKPSNTSTKKYSLRDLRFHGVINWGGFKFTYYSQSVLPGGGLRIPGRHINANGYVADKDGYIVVANSRPKGSVVPTPFGAPGKVYDRGTYGNHIDIYTK